MLTLNPAPNYDEEAVQHYGNRPYLTSIQMRPCQNGRYNKWSLDGQRIKWDGAYCLGEVAIIATANGRQHRRLSRPDQPRPVRPHLRRRESKLMAESGCARHTTTRTSCGRPRPPLRTKTPRYRATIEKQTRNFIKLSSRQDVVIPLKLSCKCSYSMEWMKCAVWSRSGPVDVFVFWNMTTN